ncbi:MAG: carboxypeptidase M32, partial [Cyanobacteria bacterium]|nr:carboxypeptidase M32 [Cyanobacteriota bacterium]
YPKAKQFELIQQVLEKMGYDFKRGRQDLTVHPFMQSIGSPFDARVTTKINEKDIFDGLGSSMHEAGHALYEQGVSPKLAGTPLATGTSLGMHESQSRLWENIVGRSKAFWQHFYPEAQKLFPRQLKNVTLEQFVQATNEVKPSLIRIEADEVTYNLHVMIRYETEKALIEKKLEVKDVPEFWNKKMEEYLGVTPQDLKEGAFQDVHWSSGLFGYFPTYTLGNLASAQLYRQAEKDIAKSQGIPNALEKQIAHGELLPLREWLRAKVHAVGSMETSEQILKRVTGEPLNAKYFMDYLWTKYSDLYQLDPAQRTATAPS